MAGKTNLALNVTRQTRAPTWQHALVSDVPAPAVAVELKDGSNVFPLYLYPNSEQHTLTAERRTNFSEGFITDLKARLKLEWKDEERGDLRGSVGPEDVFDYAIAIFWSSGYRSRYVEFLKRDFPYLPITSNVKLFANLARKGRELTNIQLMQSERLEKLITEFPIKGDNRIDRVEYATDQKRVWINASQYFGGVPGKAWNSLVGGYQPCQKWLEDRKGRKLTYDDVQHWQKIVVAIVETIRLEKAIDAIIPGWPLP